VRSLLHPTFLAVGVALAGVFAFAQQAEEEPPETVISVDVQIVNLLATVRDKQGALVNTLNKEDFEIYEDGVKQEIRYFARQADLPLTIGLLVDTSVSQGRVVDEQRAAGHRFFERILRKDKDLAFLMSFDVNSELLQDLTASVRLLDDGLRSLQVEGGVGGITPGPIPTSGRQPGTVMFDAVYLAAKEVLSTQAGRKAVVLIGDGNDWGSKVDDKAAIEAAHRSDTAIYSIRYFDREFYYRAGAVGTGGYGTLKKLSRETGGGIFEVTRKQTLDDIFDQIDAEIRNQYSLGYSPIRELSAEGFRKIEVRVKGRGYTVQARNGYYPESFR
jgi:VWFA-related protein